MGHIYIYIYIDLGKFHHDLIVRPNTIDDGWDSGNHRQLAQQFRSVNYSNLPRLMSIWRRCDWN